ncbi:NAD(P)/FAD-dependent oxidoreductase [Nisaea denitrificans]|uniref:NAD(P)/FAD-dependent oxidoreductase n=1 Tax=Nisaea denitrificans TaxID=390877 RepID=UPI00048A8132|nr:FAD-binding oxidoreductase [Nisaea denitrificans]
MTDLERHGAGYVDSYYGRTLKAPVSRPPLAHDLDCDVCVVGGGMAGLATALGLAERGKKVVVLEAQRVGWGASGRNGGFVSAGYSLGSDGIEAVVGREDADAIMRLSLHALALIRSRLDQYGIDAGPMQDGIVKASWHRNADGLKASAEKMNKRFDLGLEFKSREEMKELYRTERYNEGLLDPTAFQFHSLNFTNGIADACTSLGATVYENSAVTHMDLSTDKKRINTATGSVTANQVVICCSGYIRNLHPKLSRATLPVGTYVVLTEPLGDRLQDAIRAPYATSDSRLAGDYYRALPDTRLLWGGRVSSNLSPRNLGQKMIGDILKIYPQLEGIRAEVAWPGTMGYSVHKMPQIGQLQPGVWYNQGYGGHGMCATTAGGEVVAKAIAEDDDTYKLFAPFGLDFAGGPLGPLIAQCAYWGFQIQDRWQAWRSH